MGLDAVELLLATEEEFQIVILDEEAEKCATPNLLTDLVYSKLWKSEDDVCPSMHGFYVIRKALIEQMSLPRNLIKVESKLDSLIGRKGRKKKWNELLNVISDGQTTGFSLVRSKWIKATMFSFVLIVFLYTLIKTEGPMLALISAVITWYVLSFLTLPLKNTFPSGLQTVKDLIGILGSRNSEKWSREEVLRRVITLVSIQTGIKEEDIMPDHHFLDDLGMG